MTLLAFPGTDVDLDVADTVSFETAPSVSLSPAQKAAVLVLQLGRDAAAPVLAQLGEAELEELSTEIASMGTVPASIADAVVGEFVALLDGGSQARDRGGLDTAMTILSASVGAERASAIADRVSANFVELPFAFLQQLDHRQIVTFLCDEHPQTIALVLAHLPADLASHVLAGLTRDLQADVAHRIAVMDRTTPELIRQVESSLEKRLASLGVRADLSAIGGLKPLVDIINRADSATERMIMDGLTELDPALAEKVRAQMFTFADIVTLDDRSVQLIVRQVAVNELALALKGVPDAVRAKVTGNMSERAARDLTDELEVLGPQRLHVVEEAQAGVVRAIRQLEESGEITLGRGDDDAFVA